MIKYAVRFRSAVPYLERKSLLCRVLPQQLIKYSQPLSTQLTMKAIEPTKSISKSGKSRVDGSCAWYCSSRCILFEPSQRVYDLARENSADAIEANRMHDRGRWEHKHANELLLLLSDASSFMNKTYLPIEVEWMCEGQRISTNFLGIMPRWNLCTFPNSDISVGCPNVNLFIPSLSK